ncbi:hypothetical protein DIPPA_01741 [Diplonema papillatum]|nr:hypothetical protein DIPPA_01741 [Diplonema papillatum]
MGGGAASIEEPTRDVGLKAKREEANDQLLQEASRSEKRGRAPDADSILREALDSQFSNGSVTDAVLLTGLRFHACFCAVDSLLRSRVQPRDQRGATKILEQLWLDVMQAPQGGSLEDPWGALFSSTDALDVAERQWSQRISALPFGDVLEVYSNKHDDLKVTDLNVEVRQLSGAQVQAYPNVMWDELNSTINPKRKSEIVLAFDGDVLVCTTSDSSEQKILLTRPLTTSALQRLASQSPRLLLLHSLVYGSMFVTGQAMGLSQRLHDQLLREPWAAVPDDKTCVVLEMYAHLVNRRCSPHPFLSMIPVADGSWGRAQDLDFSKLVSGLRPGAEGYCVIFCNPPYVETLLNRDLSSVVAALESASAQNKKLTVVSLLPDWADNAGVAAIMSSKQLRSHWLLPKNGHLVALENGREVAMSVNQRLSLLSTEEDVALSNEVWAAMSIDSSTSVPAGVKVK